MVHPPHSVECSDNGTVVSLSLNRFRTKLADPWNPSDVSVPGVRGTDTCHLRTGITGGLSRLHPKDDHAASTPLVLPFLITAVTAWTYEVAAPDASLQTLFGVQAVVECRDNSEPTWKATSVPNPEDADSPMSGHRSVGSWGAADARSRHLGYSGHLALSRSWRRIGRALQRSSGRDERIG